MKGVDDNDTDPPFVVCVPFTTPLYFPDNLIEHCEFCYREVQVRPTAIWPRRICCAFCFEERHEPHDTVKVTDVSIREFRDWQKKQQQ